MSTRVVDYTIVLPDVTAALMSRSEAIETLDEDEFRAVVSLAYRAAVRRLAEDSRLYRRRLALDIFSESRDYTVTPPADHTVLYIEGITENGAVFPKGSAVHGDSITLGTCPERDVVSAFIVDTSLIPHANVCEFDSAFVNRYHSAILSYTLYYLAVMPGRTWASSTLAEHHRGLYERMLFELERENVMRVVDPSIGGYNMFLADVVGLVGGDDNTKLPIREAALRALVESRYRAVVAEYASRTRSYRVNVRVDIHDGELNYEIVAPSGFRVLDIEGFSANDALRIEKYEVTPRDEAVFTLAECQENGWVDVELSVAPTHAQCHIDTDWLDKHYDALLDGILYSLAAQSSRPWYDTTISAAHAARYETAISRTNRARVTKAITAPVRGYGAFLQEALGVVGTYAGGRDDPTEQELNAIIESAFRSAIVSFTERSRLYRTHVAIALHDGVTSYEVTSPEGFHLLEIERIYTRQGVALDGLTIRDLRLEFDAGACPHEDVDHVYVEVSLKPHMSTCTFNEEFLDRYHEQIFSLMMASLHSQKARAWFDLEARSAHERDSKEWFADFESKVEEAITPSGLGDYTMVAADVLAAIGARDRDRPKMDEKELRSILDVTFRSAVADFAQETRLYRAHIALNIYAGVMEYPLVAPKGFTLLHIERILANNAEFSTGAEITSPPAAGITLGECPEADVAGAYMIEVSLAPAFDRCTFDRAFVETHRSQILNGMFRKLYAMKSRQWYDGELLDRYTARFAEDIKRADDESINRVEPTGLGDYTLFLPALIHAFTPNSRGKKIREAEARAVIQIAFRDTVNSFARETQLYRTVVGLDIYKGVCDYVVPAPAGFIIMAITTVLERDDCFDECNVVAHNTVVLRRPPEKSVRSAYMLEVSLQPLQSQCTYDPEFLATHYDAILAGIRVRLAQQSGKAWGGLGRARELRREYRRLLQASKRGLTKGAKLRLTSSPISRN